MSPEMVIAAFLLIIGSVRL